MLSLPRSKIEFIKEFMAYNTMTISPRSDGDSTTVYLDGSRDLIADWRKPLSCGNFNTKTGKCGGQGT